MTQIARVTSEALQATIRRLLPSQAGFGDDLQASNVITPIIDLTPTAEGSLLDTDLARSINFGDANAFVVFNGTTVIANTAGFHRVLCSLNILNDTVNPMTATLQMSDGFSTKDVYALSMRPNSTRGNVTETVDLIVYLNSGESISAVAGANVTIIGSARQVADINGTIKNPSGFVSQ